ncbi:hypothetical protein KC872_04385 [Candidatus Kaiserbacteria bacterium]|nr:hypothetical protein [Candidatus Kaiserbacteria bacterium]
MKRFLIVLLLGALPLVTTGCVNAAVMALNLAATGAGNKVAANARGNTCYRLESSNEYKNMSQDAQHRARIRNNCDT